MEKTALNGCFRQNMRTQLLFNLVWCSRHDSNMRTWFRKPLLYPLSYGSVLAFAFKNFTSNSIVTENSRLGLFSTPSLRERAGFRCQNLSSSSNLRNTYLPWFEAYFPPMQKYSKPFFLISSASKRLRKSMIFLVLIFDKSIFLYSSHSVAITIKSASLAAS